MIKTLGAKIYAAIAHRKNQKWITRPIDAQKKVFNLLSVVCLMHGIVQKTA